jgi:hypothetical protein
MILKYLVRYLDPLSGLAAPGIVESQDGMFHTIRFFNNTFVSIDTGLAAVKVGEPCLVLFLEKKGANRVPSHIIQGKRIWGGVYPFYPRTFSNPEEKEL